MLFKCELISNSQKVHSTQCVLWILKPIQFDYRPTAVKKGWTFS